MVLGGVGAALGGALGGVLGGAEVAPEGVLVAVLICLLLAVAGVFCYLWITQKNTMDNDCVCVVDNTVHWPKGKGKGDPIWKNAFADV